MGEFTVSSPRFTRLLIGAGLVLITVGLYASTARNGFVNFDDPVYVSENPHVLHGLSRGDLRWAFATYDTGNWHPLTWLSLQLDAQLYGSSPAGFHLTNVALHAASVLLLFLALARMTQSVGRSAVVAALFAWHPLHVESVAWVAERKDVLSGFFWMLTLLAYARYAERPSFWRQFLVIGSFALGLLAKSMLVTLPFVLLLLDYWPLRRLRRIRAGDGASSAEGTSLPGLIAEKLPLFVLAGASCIVTWRAQHHGGTVRALGELSAAARVENAVVAYFLYLAKMLWPAHLGVLYPHRTTLFPPLAVAAAAAFFVIVSLFALKQRRTRPYLLVGWFWYVGTLVPVIGLVQVGAQALADRYTYVPLIGIFLAVTWGVADAAARLGQRRAATGLAAAAAAACLGMSWVQIGYWHDSITLWEHTLQAAEPSALAHGNLGAAYAHVGRLPDAIAHYRAALKLQPDYWIAQYNLGTAMAAENDFAEAAQHFHEAVSLNPGSVPARIELARALARIGQTKQAEQQLTLVLENDPANLTVHCELGRLLRESGDYARATREYRVALELDPTSADAAKGLAAIAWVRATHPSAVERDGPVAVELARAACQAAREPHPEFFDILAAAFAENGAFEMAVATGEKAIAASTDSDQRSAMQKRLALYRQRRPYRDPTLASPR